MRKRILSMVLCISMALTFMPRPVLMAQTGGRTPDNPDQSTSPGAFTMQMRGGVTPAGDGTLEQPYLISTMEELYWFADATVENAALCAKLTEDITVNPGAVSSTTEDPVSWIPIGTSEVPYLGTFDGMSIALVACTARGMPYQVYLAYLGVQLRM